MSNLSDSWRILENVKNEYIQEISQAAQTEIYFDNFKRGTQMRTVVENTPCDQGRIELTELVNVYPEFIHSKYMDKILQFEKIGNPITCTYPELSQPIAPSTIRFIHQTAKIKKYFGDVNGWEIAEIGAGYGGLATILHTYFYVVSYTLFDLPEAIALQTKYISRCTPYAAIIKEVCPFDLLIASCSWSELTTELKKEYIENIFKKSRNGFLIINWDFEENLQLLKEEMPDAKIWVPEPHIILFRLWY